MKRDRWSTDGMPEGDALRQINQGIDAVMREIIRAPHIPQSASMIPPAKREPEPKGSGWTNPRPMTPPSGIEHVDRIAESFARQDRIAQIRQLRENAEIERRYRGEDNNVKTSWDPMREMHTSLRRDDD